MAVFGVGNPLLDMMVTADDTMYKKYDLSVNNAILAEEKHMPIYEEVAQQPGVHYEAGGSTLNTLRMLQWLLKTPYSCTFSGCIADDESGRMLELKCEKVQLRTLLQTTDSGLATGRCAVLVKGVSRSMVTYLGASKDLSLDFIKKQAVWQHVQQAKACYIAGYVINSCYEAILEVGKYMAVKPNGLFCFNFSAPFLPSYFSKEIDTILPFVDILFMNEEEARAYAKTHDIGNQTLPQVAEYLAVSPRYDGVDKRRVVIITQGANPVIVFDSMRLEVRRFDVPQLAPDSIVDTNGAGDGFTAGFIAEYIQTKSIKAAIKSALKSAAYIICRSGFSLGNRAEY